MSSRATIRCAGPTWVTDAGPLAELLVGSGLRISEALGLRVGDLELEETGGMIVVYRSRKKQAIGSTKSDRFRSVEIGPALCAVLGDQLAQRAELASDERADSILFVMPVRTIKRSNGRWESTGVARPLDRNTVSRDLHKHALEDAALRDMPLHALRHTAAAAWLASASSAALPAPLAGSELNALSIVAPPTPPWRASARTWPMT